jgi:hypothetical protein
MALLLLAASILPDFAAAQTCKWTGKGGQDLTWVKLMWFKRDTQADKDNPPIVGFEERSVYRRLTEEQRKRLVKFTEDPDILLQVVPEIFGEGGGGKTDAYYFLSDDAFQPSPELKDAEQIPLEQGQKFEILAKPCARYPDKYKGLHVRSIYRDGQIVGEEWLSPIAIDEINREKSTKPLLLFGILLGVVVVGTFIGIVGIRIGDKERAVEE